MKTPPRTRFWIGLTLLVAGIGLALMMQIVSGEWFPPPISMSQYGVGANGWIFSLWVISLAASPMVLQAVVPHRHRWGSWLLLVGGAGTVVMAVVPTDPGGDQSSVSAKIHLFGAILALFCIPLGVTMILWGCGRRWRWIGLLLLTVIATACILLILAAAGLDTAGRGPQLSWVWWQTVAAVLDHVIVGFLAIATWQFVRSPAMASVQ